MWVGEVGEGIRMAGVRDGVRDGLGVRGRFGVGGHHEGGGCVLFHWVGVWLSGSLESGLVR